MKLIIKEFLSQLKESGELDRLMPDLLARMKIIPISRPQVGVRQNGVDIAAVGKDKSGHKRLYLFVLKVGDLGRADWWGDMNAVSPSVGQINQTYLRTSVRPEHKLLPVTIVICSTGELKQDVVQDFTGMCEIQEKMGITLEYWSGDDLASLVEEHLLDEYAIDPSARADLRRALALIGSRDYDLRHAYSVLNSLLLKSFDASARLTSSSRKKFMAQLKTANLVLEIAFRWAQEGGNLLNAFRLGERCCLWAWESIRIRGLTEYRPAMKTFKDICNSHLRIGNAYVSKMERHFMVRDGASVFSGENALVTNKIYEQIGILSEIGLQNLEFSNAPTLDAETRVEALRRGARTSELLEGLIFHNQSSFSPRFDENAIEVSLAMLLFFATGRHGSARSWLEHLSNRLRISLGSSDSFPIASDSIDDLVALEVRSLSKAQIERLRHLSTLAPTLMHWCVFFGFEDLYQLLQTQQSAAFKGVSLQLWYADASTECHLYREPAQYESGTTEVPMHFPATIGEQREQERLKMESGNVATLGHISAVSHGFPTLVIMACRHFRTPVSPQFWVARTVNAEERGPSAQAEA
ncbi:TPA: hypothetical protein UM358_000505 [Stenotrophomonas maltophilia]|nr:hypothetical protein [Stenotrophomonas maltophilia]HEL4204072.1 hypothetical protein [Stenotrophomonas maltophilia]